MSDKNAEMMASAKPKNDVQVFGPKEMEAVTQTRLALCQLEYGTRNPNGPEDRKAAALALRELVVNIQEIERRFIEEEPA